MTLPRANAPAFMPPDTRVEVVRMDGSDAVHGAALGEVLHTVVRNDAVAHGAAFNGEQFPRCPRSNQTEEGSKPIS